MKLGSVEQLREEAQKAIADVQRDFAAEFALMDEVRIFVEEITVGPLKIKNGPEINSSVVLVIRGLLTKACKTLRAIQAVTGVGCGQDASTLLRSMFETATAVSWILDKESIRRATMVAAFEDHRRCILVAEASKTPSLAAEYTAELVEKATAKAEAWRSLLGDEHFESCRKHWSGVGSLQETCRQLGEFWIRAYSTMYRHLSTFPHGGDITAHMMSHPETGEPVLRLLPGDLEVDRVCAMAPTLLLQMLKELDLVSEGKHAARIDEFNDRTMALVTARKARVAAAKLASSPTPAT